MKSMSIIYFSVAGSGMINLGFFALQGIDDFYRLLFVLAGLILLNISVNIAFEIGV